MLRKLRLRQKNGFLLKKRIVVVGLSLVQSLNQQMFNR